MRSALTSRWPLVPLKWLVKAGRPITYGIVQAGEDVPNGIPYVRPVDMDDEHGASLDSLRRTSPEIAEAYARSTIRRGDLVVSIGPSFGKVMIVPAELAGANLTQGTARVAPVPAIAPRFLFWVLRSKATHQFWDAGCAGATFRALTLELLGETPVPLPPLDVQQLIADFLDERTTGVDQLVEQKGRLLERLIEKRVSLTTVLVKKGLAPSRPVRPSNIDCVGDVPVEWSVVRNKVLFREVSDRSTSGVEELLTVSHLTGVTRRSDKPDVNMFLAESMEGYKLCQADDLVINTMWAWMGALGVSPCDGIVSPSYNVYRLRDRSAHDPGFFDLAYRTPPFVAEITRNSKGIWSSRLRLYPEAFLTMLTPVPPLGEQRAIVERVRMEARRDDPLATKLRESVAKLREYRDAMITGAVMGYFDVRKHREEAA